MVAEVLRPKNCLVDRIEIPSVSFHHRRKGNTKSSAHRKSAQKVDKFKFEAENSRNFNDDVKEKKKKKNRKNNGPVMGQVTILKRGESLNSKKIMFRSEITKDEVDLLDSGIERMGLEPDLFSKDVKKIGDLRSVLSPLPLSSSLLRRRLDIYAGSVVMSPSPNSLPLPSFSSKKQFSKIVEDDSATKDLCRILQLE